VSKYNYDDYDKITRSRYKELVIKEAVLDALEAGGVDNWEWYSQSLEDAGIFDDEDKEDD